MYNNYENKEFVMSKKNLNGLKELAKHSVERALHYDFMALCEDIKSAYVSDSKIANIFYGAENGLIKGRLDSEYMEDYIPYSSKKFTNVFPGYTYIEHHQAEKPKKEFEFGDKLTEWDSLNVDMSKYLALRFFSLFKIINKLTNPKITANNYNMTNEELAKLGSVLSKALEYQKQLVEEQYDNKLISQKNFDELIAMNKKYKIITEILPDIWNDTKIEHLIQEYKSKNNHLKNAKIKLIKFHAKNEILKAKKQPENDYSTKESHSEL